MNEQINLFEFIDDQVFLTKSGDVGIVLAVKGVDFECLDGTTVDALKVVRSEVNLLTRTLHMIEAIG